MKVFEYINNKLDSLNIHNEDRIGVWYKIYPIIRGLVNQPAQDHEDKIQEVEDFLL